MMDEAVKDRLTARFRAYLDSANETTAAANAESSGNTVPDLFTLLAEVAALKSEVKLESRHVKAALEEFRGLFDELRQANARLAEEHVRRREQERLVEQQTQQELLLELLELRDRLQAGHDQAARYRPGWWQGRATGFIVSMAEGMAMNLRRLDDTLTRRGVRPLQAVGQAFDAQTMHATELARDPTREEGLVVQELRKGFWDHDRLLRPAEVVVNQHAQSPGDT